MRRRRTVPTLLFGLSVFFTLAALTGLQATGATAGPTLLGRLAATIFELERWTPAHQEDLEAAARDRAFGTIEVHGLPIALSISSTTALSGDEPEVRAAIAAAAGRRLYEEGRAAFVSSSGGRGDLSITEPARWAIALLEQEDHALWQIAFGAGVLALALSGALLLIATSAGLPSASRATVGSALLFALGCGAATLLAQVGSGSAGTPIDSEVARILRDCAVIGLRAGLAVAAAGIALLLMLRLVGQPDHRYEDWPRALDEAAS